MKPIIIIPAYQPGQELIGLIDELAIDPQQKMILVDDGSIGKAQEIFERIANRHYQVEILRHATHLGKGQALKNGFNYFLVHYVHNCSGVVTVDADEHHIKDDIIRVSNALQNHPQALCVGSREESSDVPIRRQLWNKMTIQIFKMVTGVTLKDTQTGLRGIPSGLLPDLLHSTDTGNEFELDMLIRAAKRGFQFYEIPIQPIQKGDNIGSHFYYFRDSFKIFFVFLRFSMLSFATAVIDYLVFVLAYWYSHNLLLGIVSGRLAAGAFQFTLGKFWVFKSANKLMSEAVRYAALVSGLMLLSYGLITPMVIYLKLSPYVSKLLAEGGIFLLSFAAQNLFVYATPADQNEKTNWEAYYNAPYKTSSITRKFTEKKLHQLIEAFRPDDIQHICELGGGNSIFFQNLRERFPQAIYTIIDNNQRGLDAFQEQHHADKKIVILNGNVVKPEFPVVKADLVFSVGLVEHFLHQNTAKAIQTHFVCAKPGSLVILTFPTATWLYKIARHLAESVGAWKFPDERPLSLNEVVDEVEKYGKICHVSINWLVVFTQGIVVARAS
jgi:glycosyltransferase involved in cell wall biosynthesis/trans-aconitate methyltransferase